MSDFYEEDEPIEDVLRAFNEGCKGVTAPQQGLAIPRSLKNVTIERCALAGDTIP